MLRPSQQDKKDTKRLGKLLARSLIHEATCRECARGRDCPEFNRQCKALYTRYYQAGRRPAIL